MEVLKFAWCQANGDNHAWPVASLKPNDFGLFDMQGNAGEWCYDRFSRVLYKDAAADALKTEAVSNTINRVVRGASFEDPASYLRSADRLTTLPGDRITDVGFRPARTYHLFP